MYSFKLQYLKKNKRISQKKSKFFLCCKSKSKILIFFAKKQKNIFKKKIQGIGNEKKGMVSIIN